MSIKILFLLATRLSPLGPVPPDIGLAGWRYLEGEREGRMVLSLTQFFFRQRLIFGKPAGVHGRYSQNSVRSQRVARLEAISKMVFLPQSILPTPVMPALRLPSGFFKSP